MKLRHAVWLAGFRPFFILGMISGIVLPLLWAGVFSGLWQPSLAPLAPVQWHAHEMLFGFGWAILGGFLLTASKNWVNVRGIHGAALIIAASLWICERIGVFFYADLPSWMRLLTVNACVAFVAGYIQWTLIRHREQDSFKDNFIFLFALPLFLVAKNLILSRRAGFYVLGWTMAVGLYRVAFAVMFERTLTQFMKNSMQIQLLRQPLFDGAIKASVFAAVFAGFMPSQLAAGVCAIAGILLLIRFFLWRPVRGFSNFGIGLSYLGLLALATHFLLESIRWSGVFNPIGSITTHVFSFLCMGIVIPAMIIRISQGHTGRKLVFAFSDRIAIAAMLIAALFRLIATQIWPQHYATWITVAAIGWASCFALLAWRLIPFLVQPRIDGREH